MTQPTRYDSCLSIHRATRAMHQRNRTVSSAYGTDLRIADTSVLVETLGEPGISHSRLAESLLLHAVTISRIVKKLDELRLIKIKASANDKRRKEIWLTARGEKRARETVALGASTFGAAFDRIASGKRKVFTRYMHELCSGIHAPAVASLKGDPPLMVEIRQLTRVFGLLGESVFDSGLSPLEWHILAQVCTTRGEVLIQDISAYYSINQNTVSHLVQRLVKQGLLERGESSTDRRRRPLLPAKKGIARHEEIEKHAANQLLGAVHNLNAQELREFALLWNLYSGSETGAESIVLDATARIEQIRSSARLLEARRFLLEQRVAQEMLDSPPEQYAGKNSLIFALSRGSRLCGVLEARELPRQPILEVTHLLTSSDTSEQLSVRFVQRAVREIFNISNRDEIEIERAQTSPPLWKALVPRRVHRKESWRISRGDILSSSADLSPSANPCYSW